MGSEVHQCPTNDGRYMLRWFECQAEEPRSAFEGLSLSPSEVMDARWLLPEEVASLEPIFEATKSYFTRIARQSLRE